MTKQNYSQTYKTNRAALLASNPPCHWCGAPATTADHLIERDRDGDDSLENLVPACQPCNSSRGARYRNHKQSARQAARNIATNTDQTNRFLGTTPITPSKRLGSLSETDVSERGWVDRDGDGVDYSSVGRIRPRLETPRGTFAPYADLVADFAARYLGYELLEWQRYVVEGMFDAGAGGELKHSKALVTCARQNGKSWIIKPLIGAWCTSIAALRGRPQVVLSCAHELGLSSLTFEEVAPILEEYFGAKAKWSFGRMELKMPDGTRWFCRAATPTAPHGLSIDLAVADEIWSIKQEVLTAGIEKAQRARPESMLAMFSTAGTNDSLAMLAYREAGLRIIDRGTQGSFYLAAYEPPPGADTTDPYWWGWANPSLGITIPREQLEQESQDDTDRAGFLRGSLNMFVTTENGFLPPGVWEGCETEADTPAGGVLAVDSAVDSSQYVGLRAAPDDAGVIHVTVAFTVDSIVEFQRVTERLLTADSQLRLAVTPTLEGHVSSQFDKRKTVVGYAELMKYCGLVRGLIMESRVQHRGEELLAEHVSRAVAVRQQHALVLSSKRSAGSISLARCLVFAVSLASKPATNRRAVLGIAR